MGKDHSCRHQNGGHEKRQGNRRHERVIRAFLVFASHADGGHRRAAHGEHCRDRCAGGNKRYGDIDRAQRGRTNALPDENAIHHVVEVRYKKTAQRGQDVADQGFHFCDHVIRLLEMRSGTKPFRPRPQRKNKSGIRPETVLSHFNDHQNRKSSNKRGYCSMFWRDSQPVWGEK